MSEIERVCRLVGDIEVAELERWIGESWVLPTREGEGESAYVFHDVDVARVRLIVNLRRDCAIDDDAMPMVLNLLDQLYALRRRMRSMRAAVDALPSELRAALARQIEGE
jgi:chaperone modulatory protein CbpM